MNTCITFRPDHSVIPKLLLLVVFLAGCGAYVITPGDTVATALGWASVALAAVVFILVIHALLRRGAQVIIDERGIDDRQSGLGLIPWRAVRDVAIQVHGGGNGIYLCLEVDRPGDYLARLSVLRRVLARLNPMIGVSTVMINFSMLTPSIYEALPYIREIIRSRSAEVGA